MFQNMKNSIRNFFSRSKLSSELATRANVDRIISFFNYLPDPDPILRKLGKDISVYRELSTDPHVFANVNQRKSSVTSLNWEVSKESSKENEYQIIKGIFDKLDVENLISQILNAPLFGMSILEVTWKYEDGYIIPAKIEEKPQEWFTFSQDNTLKLKTWEHPEGVDLPPNKFLIAQNDATYMNPFGERALSRVFWSVTFKRGGIKFWITFSEKYGIPYLIGKQPRAATKEDAEDLLLKLENMIQDACAVIPEDSSVSILETKGSSTGDAFSPLVQFFNSEISKAILTQTLTTELQGKGSYAASNTHNQKLNNLTLSDKRLVEKTLNKLIKWIYELNFNSLDRPVLKLFAEEDVDKVLAERDELLTKQGVRFTKTYYKKNYDLEDDDFELSSNRDSNENPKPVEFSEEGKIASKFFDQRKIDDLIQSIPNELMQMHIEQTLRPVLDLINKGSDYSEVMESLVETYPKMKTSQLEQLLEKAIFYSETWGRLNA